MESLQSLVDKVGIHATKTIIEGQVRYPRTASLVEEDKALVNLDYEMTLSPIIKQIQNNMELKPLDVMKDAVTILSMMEEFRESILLSQADLVVVCKGGFDILKLTNKCYPKSGRCICIEINSCKNELIRMVQYARGREIPWLEIGIGFGVAVLVVMQSLKSS